MRARYLSPMLSFADLLAPFSERQFLDSYYGRRPLYIDRGGRNTPDLLSWQRLNELLELHPYWTEPHLKLIMQGREAQSANYCDRVETLTGPVSWANPKKIQAFLGMGASLVANRIHAVSPPVRAAAAVLEKTFEAKVGANAYCSFKGVQAFTTHYDLHDVFAFQTEGEKIWRVYQSRADAPTTALPPGDATEKWLIESRGPLLFEVRMKPGDMLYLPRGQYHDALATSKASLHVTFSVSPMTGLDIFDVLKKEAARDSFFRSDMPNPRDEDGRAIRQHLDTLAERLAQIVRSPIFFTELMNESRRERLETTRYALPDVATPTYFVVNQKPARLARGEREFFLVGSGENIPLGAAHDAVVWLVKQRWFTAEDLAARFPYIEADELKRVLDRLLAAGFIARSQPNA